MTKLSSKRMFFEGVVETDRFYDLPLGAQSLYFHLCMNADDDGIVAGPQNIRKLCGCSPEDFNSLETAGFIIVFSSGVCVITDWHLNNNLQGKKYHPTVFVDELNRLALVNKRYELSNPDSQYRVVKISGVERSEEQQSGAYAKPLPAVKQIREPQEQFEIPNVADVQKYCNQRKNKIDPQHFVDYYNTRDWYSGKAKMHDWKAAIREWERMGMEQPLPFDAKDYINSISES